MIILNPETQDIDAWINYWNGCVHCSCDFGCNQWVFEQRARAALIMKAMRQGKSKDRLDKLVQIPIERANKLWYYMERRYGRKFRETLEQVQEYLNRKK